MAILVTGGCGFIGPNFIRHRLEIADETVICLDKLTYAGSRDNLADIEADPRYLFVQAGIEDGPALARIFGEHEVTAVVNFAAETHVDRSIRDAAPFVATNVAGTLALLEAALAYWRDLPDGRRETFRFLHMSTDEVYGSLGPDDDAFTEAHPYRPNSPYAATKAAADHLVRAFQHTHGLPALIACSSNNFGPHQHPEKLIPIMIVNAMAGRALPVYGDGLNVRDWLFVADSCGALSEILASGRLGETYNIGGNCQKTNIETVEAICGALDALAPRPDGNSYRDQIAFVEDRPGHDRRYAVDGSRIAAELGWTPRAGFEAGVRATVEWYLGHPDWVRERTGAEFDDWLSLQYQ